MDLYGKRNRKAKIGIRKISDEQYFATDAFSKSDSLALQRSPEYYQHHLTSTTEKTKAQIDGAIFHSMVLDTPSVFNSKYSVEPVKSDYPNVLDTVQDMRIYLDNAGASTKGLKSKDSFIDAVNKQNGNYTIWQDVLNGLGAKTLIKQEDYLRFLDMEKAVIEHLRYNGLTDMRSVNKETTVVWYDGYTETNGEMNNDGMMCKAKIDMFDHNYLYDIKTFQYSQTGMTIDEFIKMQIGKYKYYYQYAIYVRGLYRAINQYRAINPDLKTRQWSRVTNPEKIAGMFDRKNFIPPMVFVFVNKDAPHEVRSFMLTPYAEARTAGYKRWQHMLEMNKDFMKMTENGKKKYTPYHRYTEVRDEEILGLQWDFYREENET